MGNVYQNALGGGQTKDLRTFANAIRKLSTAHKRATKISDTARLQLKWAEETHNAQLAKFQADIDLTNKKNESLHQQMEELTLESGRKDAEIARVEDARKAVSTNMDSMIKAWSKYNTDPDDAEAKTKFYDSYSNILEADPSQAIEMQRVFGGLIEAETGMKSAETKISREMGLIAQTRALTLESESRTRGQELDNKAKMRDLLQSDATIEKYNKFKTSVQQSVFNNMGITHSQEAIEAERRTTLADYDGQIKIQLQKLGIEKSKLQSEADQMAFNKIMNGDFSVKLDTSNFSQEGSAAVKELERLNQAKTSADQEYNARLRENDDLEYMSTEASEYAYGTMGLRGPGATFQVAEMIGETLPILAQMRKAGATRYAELQTQSPSTPAEDINWQVTGEVMDLYLSKFPANLRGFAKNLYMKGLENDMVGKRNALRSLGMFKAPKEPVTETPTEKPKPVQKKGLYN